MSKILNIKVICIQNGFERPIKAKYKTRIGILEFLNLIKHAEYIVTDSFHGVAFSIIYRKNLKIVLKNNFEELNSRLNSLANEFDLEDNIVSVDSTNKKLTEKTKYNNVVIDNSIMNSRDSLLNMIGDLNGKE